MEDGRDKEFVGCDVNGDSYTIDSNGARDYKYIGQQAQKNPPDGSGWTTYDSSHGHCGLCGKIYCTGSCFK